MKKQILMIAAVTAGFFTQVNAQWSGQTSASDLSSPIFRYGLVSIGGGYGDALSVGGGGMGGGGSTYFNESGLRMVTFNNGLQIGAHGSQVPGFDGAMILGQADHIYGGSGQIYYSDLGLFAGTGKSLKLGGNRSVHMTVNSLGNVGIGIATPAAGTRLHVAGNTKVDGTLTATTVSWGNSLLRNDQNGSIELGGNDNTAGGIAYLDFHGGAAVQDYSARVYSTASNQLIVGTLTGGNVLTVSGSNVGIGTISPSAKLHVGAGGNALIEGTLTVGQTTQLTVCPNNPPVNLKMLVNGKIGAKDLIIDPASWCDYVFKEDFKLRPLSEVEKFIQTNKHLPEVPSEKEVVENGVAVGDMMKIHMKKIEELTLYVVDLSKQVQVLNEKNAKLEALVK